MTEREAMLRAVCAAPHDDVPRLVFADRLDERGEPDRAAFIRAQVEADRLPEGSCFRGGYEAAAQKYLRRHTTAWRAELPAVRGWEWGGFHRGFVDELAITPDAEPVRHVERIFAAAPVTRLQISGEQSVATFVSFLRHVRELVLFGAPLPDYAVRDLCSPDAGLAFDSLLVLVTSTRLTPAGVRLLRDRFGQTVRFVE